MESKKESQKAKVKKIGPSFYNTEPKYLSTKVTHMMMSMESTTHSGMIASRFGINQTVKGRDTVHCMDLCDILI